MSCSSLASSHMHDPSESQSAIKMQSRTYGKAQQDVRECLPLTPKTVDITHFYQAPSLKTFSVPLKATVDGLG